MSPLPALTLALQALCRFKRGSKFVCSLYRLPRSLGQLRGKPVRGLRQLAGGAIGMAGSSHDQYTGLVVLQQPVYGRPVYSVLAYHHRCAWSGRPADGVSGGDSDATQSEIKSEYDPGSRLRHDLP
jgi:hypothetical protein